MTGAAFDIRADMRGTDRISRRLQKILRGVENKTDLMDEIGGLMVASTIDRFENSKSPDGISWVPSERALDESGKTLIDKGLLMGSITHIPGNDQVEVGSNLVYAGIHQFGGSAGRNGSTEIPARPYLGISIGDEFAIEEAAQDYLQDLMQ